MISTRSGFVIRFSILVFLFAGCSTPQIPQGSEMAETSLPVPIEKVRTAIIDVLTVNGYTVQEHEGDSHILTTSYRREIDGPWDGLLRWRFGVGRSLVVATMTPESESETRVSMQVTYEAKNRIFDSWIEATPPLQVSAENNIRLIRNALGLL
jgi:hypothetical protein